MHDMKTRWHSFRFWRKFNLDVMVECDRSIDEKFLKIILDDVNKHQTNKTRKTL